MSGTTQTRNFKRTYWGTYILLYVIFLASCGEKKEIEFLSNSSFKKHILNPIYAKGFTIYENDSVIRFTSRNPDDTNQIYKILDFEKNKETGLLEKSFTKICITSTTHAFLFDALSANNSIIGMTGMKYLQDSNLISTYKKNNVVEIGADDNFNRELIIATNPQLLMVYPYNGCDYSAYEKAGITVVYNAEYLEQDPLGRAEWLKIAALLVNKNKEGNYFFNSIEKAYNEVQGFKKHIAIGKVPSVILGKPIDNIWHVPGKNSFAAKLIIDAGLFYAFDGVEGNNVNSKSCEWVLTNCTDAEYWVFTDNSEKEITLQNLMTQNKAFKHLNAFKLKNVIVCNSAKADFFGKAVIEPQVLLKDLIYHFYGIDSTYKPVYFKKIK